MQSSIIRSSAVALFSAMVILAGIPSVSVLAVIIRSATFGFVHGVLTSLGIVAGDIIFIMVAIGGLSLLARLMGNLFVLIKYLGGVYLIFLGFGCIAQNLEISNTKSLLNPHFCRVFSPDCSLLERIRKRRCFI